MNADHWEQIKSLFNAAIDLDEDQRAAYLEEHCADIKIRRQVSLMLLADADVGEVTDIVSGAAGESFGQEIHPGEMIGNWRIVREIDRGGMGAVYLAERADSEYQQKAAIKIVSVALAGSQAVMRFKSERQILAKLEHPNIARLLDGGTTASGVPYLVMEYVDGERIDRYCDRHRLRTTERLVLFQKVCAAIHVAHQNLVVHRDIKPGNILVTEEGVPKLLDFGIAKLLDPDHTGAAAAVTHANMRLLTPEYASPEQVLGRPITTASDIYSLGVLMYQLLSGRPPYDVSDYSAETLARVICETDPLRPSTVAGTLSGRDGDGQNVFAARRTTAQSLKKRLRGDLDNIVLMAMRKEPLRRYPSALGLAQDIDNYLGNRPVTARTDTLGYRLGKYLRRNAAAMTASSIAVVTVISLVTFYTLRLSDERDRAQTEARKATQTAEFLQNLFRVVDPDVAQGNEVTARSLLDQGVRQLEVTLEDQPDIRASLQSTIGKVYTSLGLHEEAGPLLEEAHASFTSVRDERDPAIAPLLRQMVEIDIARGEFERANERATRAISIAREAYGNDHVEVAAGYSVIGRLQTEQGNIDDALQSLMRARAIFERLEATREPEYAATLTSLALVYDHHAAYGRSISLLEEALVMHVDIRGAMHPLTIQAQHALAVAQDRQHLYEPAEKNYLEALEKSIRLYGNSHPDVGAIQSNIGRLYSHMGQRDKSRVFVEAALETTRKVYGERHYYVGYDLVAMGKTAAGAGDNEAAESYFLDALNIYDESLQEHHPYKAALLVNYGRLLHNLGRHDEALAVFRRGQTICAAALPADHPLTAQMDLMVGINLISQDRSAEGLPLLQGGFERLLAVSGAEHAATQYALDQLLAFFDATGERSEYERYALYKINEEARGEDRGP